MTNTAPSQAPLLELDRLSKTFESRQGRFGRQMTRVRAVDNVSLQLDAGETLGLVGESGSGKSTLGRLVMRLTQASSGAIRLHGVDLASLAATDLRTLRRDVQMVFQDPYGSLDPRRTIGASLAEPMKIHGMWNADAPAKVRELIHRVGLNPEHARRYPHEFSGGQRQRIGIARALALDPRMLVLDEPVSALDVSIQAQIINLLQTLQQERGLAFLFIAHDLAVVRHVSHRIAVMYLGRIVELAPRERLYTLPAHPYTVSLLAAVPVPDPAAERRRARVTPIGEIGSAASLPSGCRFHPRCPRARQVANEVTNQATNQTANAATSAPDKRTSAPVALVDSQWGRLPGACVQTEPDLSACGGGTAVACHFPHHTVPAA